MNGLSVRDLISRDFVGVNEGDTVRGAVELMRQDGETGAVVLRGSEAVGTISAEDVLDCLAAGEDLDETPVSTIMRPNPPEIPENTSVKEAANTISKTAGDVVLITDGDGVIGILSARDLAALTWESASVEESMELTVQGAEVGRESQVDTEYSNQSICEVCGSLSRNLTNVNGQLLCPDCRSV